MRSGLKYASRSRVYMGMRLLALVWLVLAAIRGWRDAGLTGDFLFFMAVAAVWFVVTLLLDAGVRRLHWRDHWYGWLIVCMDVYFLVLCLSLLDLAAGWAVRAMALYGFVVAVISSPLTSLLAGLSGMAAYLTGYQLGGHGMPFSLPAVLALVGAGVVCGTAWRLCLPLAARAVYAYLMAAGQMPAPRPLVEAAPEGGEDGDEAVAATDAAAAPQSAQSAPATDTPAPPAADTAEWEGKLAAKDAELEALRKEKDQLATELEKTNEEMTKLFRV